MNKSDPESSNGQIWCLLMMRESGKPMAAHRSNVSNDGLEHDDHLWLQIVSYKNLAPEFSAMLHMGGRRKKQIHTAKRSGELEEPVESLDSKTEQGARGSCSSLVPLHSSADLSCSLPIHHGFLHSNQYLFRKNPSATFSSHVLWQF